MRVGAFIFLILGALGTTAIPIDNGLEGSPAVICGLEDITVVVTTQKPFDGNIYSKGFFESEKCRLKGDHSATTFTFRLPLTGECGLRRRRTVNPRGMTMESTVIIMFHRLFLTKVDQAFHVKCMYMEADKEVTQTLEVSMLPSTELPSLEDRSQKADNTMPTCKYEVMRNGPNGEALRFGIIGERVYHKWSCDGENADKYCMTVHSCVVDDGLGLGQQLIDENGCAMDRYLLNNLDYSGPVTAGQEAHVFKFADRPTIFFSCQIRLHFKDQKTQLCVRSSDTCEILNELSKPKEVTLKLPRREGSPDDIENDFPRPSHQIGNFDFDEEDEITQAPTFFARRKKLRHSRDLDGNVGFDIEVASAGLDVIEIPENHSFNPFSAMEITRELFQESEANKICLTRRESFVFLVLLTLLFMCSSLISIAIYARRRQLLHSSNQKNFLTNILKCDA
ncbi:hypothetical protein L596_012372 [Steinernema carpocapsae]|uniref:ZP domain-containing protein n=1 Tax=Steinernema carpocapsae TaxID=34508 RepID=A0A4U5NX39_STECR|nr:hypothetical protein L596_012372 [Steinernema carpocapsae]